MPRPNFFIVGQPKSGTTAFYEYLRTHPEIFAPERKEIHYFCTDFHEENASFHGSAIHFPIRDEEHYLSYFRPSVDQHVVAEASVHYLYSRVAARNIYEFNPDAKILVLLRNPLDFLSSWHAHAQLSNGEIIESFEAALAAENERKNGRLLSPLVKVPSYLFYSERIRYAEQIQRFFDVFPREQVKVLFFEDFTADNAAIYVELLGFLGINSTVLPEFRIVNERKQLRFKGIARMTKRPKVQQALRRAIPQTVRARLRLPKLYRSIFLQPQAPEPLSPESRRALMERFRSEVAKVSSLLQRDALSLWGY